MLAIAAKPALIPCSPNLGGIPIKLRPNPNKHIPELGVIRHRAAIFKSVDFRFRLIIVFIAAAMQIKIIIIINRNSSKK